MSAFEDALNHDTFAAADARAPATSSHPDDVSVMSAPEPMHSMPLDDESPERPEGTLGIPNASPTTAGAPVAAPEKDLSYLNEAAGGIDFNALREKYRHASSYASSGTVTGTGASGYGYGGYGMESRAPVEASHHTQYSEEEIINTSKALDKYSICKTCSGLGIVTEVYNHFRIDKTCPECDGEALTSRRFADLSAELNLDAGT